MFLGPKINENQLVYWFSFGKPMFFNEHNLKNYKNNEIYHNS